MTITRKEIADIVKNFAQMFSLVSFGAAVTSFAVYALAELCRVASTPGNNATNNSSNFTAHSSCWDSKNSTRGVEASFGNVATIAIPAGIAAVWLIAALVHFFLESCSKRDAALFGGIGAFIIGLFVGRIVEPKLLDGEHSYAYPAANLALSALGAAVFGYFAKYPAPVGSGNDDHLLVEGGEARYGAGNNTI